jgi:UDP-N-acetylglucosamine--N-acetylmuramyl-(pentapeptide) pyrophosphoryl-undecaprenol N-acetylglucosamine transferase
VSRPKILIAGGGTGGHVFPAVAVAEALHGRADVETVFCGTSRGVEARVIPERGWHLELLDVHPIKGGGPRRALRGALSAARATLRSLGLVSALRPRAVLSVGGYAAGPVTLAAAVLGIPVAILEPNSVVGLTNRWLAPFARRAYIAWDDAGHVFRRSARRPLGVPLRAGFLPKPYVAGSPMRLLVMGGSQGASALNERLPEAVALASASAPIDVLHQTGRDREAAVREAYARQGVTRATVVPFIDDVAGAIAESDLVVARAGAGTVAEIAAIGRASILVPFPHAADDHQHKNAAALAARGAAVCLPQPLAEPRRIAAEIARLAEGAEERAAMARAARAHGRPNAARDIADDLLALARISARAHIGLTNGAHANGLSKGARGSAGAGR